MEAIKVDKFVPNYNKTCDVCGANHTVSGVVEVDVSYDRQTDLYKGRELVVYDGDMCGVCTWGESRCIDPSEWNK